MGAETSTLQSIESLNATLSDIENKLGVVEDIHLHHERNICQDDSVVLSGKIIKCNSSVSLNVGPVIGLLGQRSVRILVETNRDAEITFNVFVIDDKSSFSRFHAQHVSRLKHLFSLHSMLLIFSTTISTFSSLLIRYIIISCHQRFRTEGGRPKAFTVRDLEPETHYSVYVGGIQSTCKLHFNNND